jgi:hypothetical protein
VKGNNKIQKVMHEFKQGTLNIGKSAKKVKDRTQAIAIAMSEQMKFDSKKKKKKNS